MDAVIVFATLFLGLVDGEREITLDVAPEVAAVELVLDGTLVARLEQAPWAAKIDFGAGFLPHVLDARALDETGEVLGHRWGGEQGWYDRHDKPTTSQPSEFKASIKS